MSIQKDTSLTDSEIRPDHLKKGQMDAFLEDIANLVRQRDNFVTIACPACGSKKYRHAFEKCGLSYAECDCCETVFINPRPTPEILEQYYATSKNYSYWNTYIFPSSEHVRRVKIFQPRVEKILAICKKYLVNTGTLLEVGAGFGTFCEELTKTRTFQKIFAVEPTPDLAETCRKKGLEVIQLPIEKVRLERESVDVVVSFEVIEHLFDPGEFIRSCGSVLSPGGLLVLSCPNVKGFDILVLGRISDSIDVEHLNYFTPDSLSYLVSGLGFEVLETTTPGRLDAEMVRKKIINGEFDVSSQPFLEKVLVRDWEKTGSVFQDFLSDSNNSSHLWLVARKK